MSEKKLIHIDKVNDKVLSSLENRDVALWLRSVPKNLPAPETLVAFLGLPWRMVFSEMSDPRLVEALEDPASSSGPMIRKRGFVQIIDSDPSRIELPQRCLPTYLLNGRHSAREPSEFESKLRRITMLEELRRSAVREILVISGDDDPVPPELKDLWSSGFRSHLTFASDSASANASLESWLRETDGIVAANLSDLPAARLIEDILERYSASYPEDRHVIRVRDQHGTSHKIDVTEADEPERPILDWYSLIEDRDLTPLMPQDLSEEDFVAFFQNPESSWRPYAAGLPWIRDAEWKNNLGSCLRKLDVIGSEENCVAYVMSEPGAGGTTLARMLAWEYAREGYPVLIAKPLPFVPDSLAIANFLNRAHHEIRSKVAHGREFTEGSDDSASSEGGKRNPVERRYETPWIIVFDRLHWEYRDSELRQFCNELKKQGRPVCVLVVTGPIREMSYFDTSIFKQVAELNHILDQEDVRQLGRHLNQFLRVYGKQRESQQWDQFYQHHTVHYVEGIAALDRKSVV